MTLRVAFFVFMLVHQHEKRTNATIRKTNGIALSTRIDKCVNVSLGVSYWKYHEKYIFRQQTFRQFKYKEQYQRISSTEIQFWMCLFIQNEYSGFTNKFTNRRYLLLSIIDQQNAVLHVCIEEINMLPQHMFKQFPRGAFLCILFIYLDTSLNYGIVMDHYNIVL